MSYDYETRYTINITKHDFFLLILCKILPRNRFKQIRSHNYHCFFLKLNLSSPDH